MGSSILQLAQDAADDGALSLARPSSLFPVDDDGDTSPRKLLRAVTRTAQFLAATYDWQALRREQVFLSVAQEVQSNALPPDLLRFVPATFWNRTLKMRLSGPLNPDEWQQNKTLMMSSGFPAFAQRGDDLMFSYVPAAGLVCAFEYVTKNIGYAAATVAFTGTTDVNSNVMSVANTTGLAVGMAISGPSMSSGSIITAVAPSTSITTTGVASASVSTGAFIARTPRTRFAADTDVTFWDDELITQGIIWQYRMAERFDYAQDQLSFDRLMADRIKQDGGRRVVNMGRSGGSAADRRLAGIRAAVSLNPVDPRWG